MNMAIPGGGISRISHGLQTHTLLQQLRANSLRLFREQQRLASGKQLNSVGDDPVIAARIARLHQQRQGQERILTNLQYADKQLSAADGALTNVSDLLIEAARIASEQSGSLTSPQERASQAVVVDGLISQLLNIGNQKFEGLYLFGGRDTARAPFDSVLGRATFVGDSGSRTTTVAQGQFEAFDISAADVFNLRAATTGGNVNFDVQLSTDARVSELDGALGGGVRLGRIRVSQTGPAVEFDVDFTGAETVGDLVNRFNDAAAAAGSALTLGISPADGATLRITSSPGVTIQVSDVGNGTTAADLGIRKSVGAGIDLDGDNVHRRVALTTRLSDLAPGGIALAGGVRITNGMLSATVDFAGAMTVQDVLNAMNSANVGIRASINAAGTGIEIQNLIAGSPLIVGENGGTDAAALGIKTLDGTVSLSRLGGGRGIHPVSGADFRITDANGVSFDVDVSSAQSVGDVMSAINAAAALAGSTLVAEISEGGAGVRLVGPVGPGAITVEKLNVSPVAEELGILKSGSSTILEGDAVGAFRQTGVLSALYRLRDALYANDSSEITEAGSEINELQRHVSTIAGGVGARAQSIRSRLTQTESAVTATAILLSEIEDVDFTEAVTKFQQAQTALQASLMAGASVRNLSLLDFLR